MREKKLLEQFLISLRKFYSAFCSKSFKLFDYVSVGKQLICTKTFTVSVNQKIYFIADLHFLQCITTIGYNLTFTLYISNNHYGHFAGNWKRKQTFLCKILFGLKIFQKFLGGA